MTQDQIMKLVDALSEASFEQGLNRLRDFPEQARAAVVAAIESLENKVDKLEDHVTEITSEEHSIPELRQELIDQLEEKRKCYFAVSQYQKANQNLLEQVAALTKDAARWKMLAEMEASMVLSETMRFYIANPDKLDYVIELKHNAYGAAIAAQKGEQV